MTTILPLIAERFINTPLFLTAAKAETLYSVLEGRLGVTADAAPATGSAQPFEATRFVGSHKRKSGGQSFVRAEGKTALITIDGSLVNRGAWLNSNSGLVSYEGIGAQLDDVANDGEIENVVLDINSSGGEATGMVALAAKVRVLRATKYVVAVVNDVAASAAYGIASGAHEIVVSPTSVVGSIGVIMVHFDRSGELSQKGVRPTIIAVGDRKADGNPFGPLPEGAHASMIQHANTFYQQFIKAVAEGRGHRLTAERARLTQAGIYIGGEAISAGLADRVSTLDDVLSGLALRPKKPSAQKGGHKAMTSLSFEAERAVLAERQRIGAILKSPEAKGRMDHALTFALDSDMSADAAKATLSKLPIQSGTMTIEEQAGASKGFGHSYLAPPNPQSNTTMETAFVAIGQRTI